MRNLCCFLLLAATAAALEPIPNPAGPGSSQVNWALTADGNPLLSWVESETLRYAIRRGAAWSEPRTIAAKRKFFHHPAEVPGIVALPGGVLIAHWIETPIPDTEAEFIYVSASRDGIKWTTPALAHHDKSEVQHGLASMVASGDREASLFWLQALKGADAPTTLMRTVISADGAEVREEQLDGDVCECCPTASAKTARGLLVAYRDHTKDDIRDIAVTRFENGRWTSPKIVSPDKWQIDACPVNAATIAAKGDKVAVAWYTAAGNKPRVELALSSDSGATFTKAVTVSTTEAYGYASIALDDTGGAYVSWLERGPDAARLMARPVSAAGALGAITEVAKGTRKDLGYPRLLRTGPDTWVAWNTAKKVETARLSK